MQGAMRQAFCQQDVNPTPVLKDADFSPAVAARHQRLDVDDWAEIYLVGDVHGCRAELEDLLAVLDPSDDDLVLFVGDLVRKGPDSAGVLELVRDHDNFRSVRGNNEDKLIEGRSNLPSLDPHADYLAALPVAISFDDALVVHGGVDPRKPLYDHSVRDLLETRSIPPGRSYDGPFWFETYQGPPRVFFGHTVLDAPVVTDDAVGLDTGCVYGGKLTAYDYYADELVSVPARETYQQRAARKVIEPDPDYRK
jgi:serine/threonine protein phosphatase 1